MADTKDIISALAYDEFGTRLIVGDKKGLIQGYFVAADESLEKLFEIQGFTLLFHKITLIITFYIIYFVN